MNKRVEDFLANNSQNDKKNKILINAGLFDKIYMPESPDGSSHPGYDYPYSEYNSKLKKRLYYRKQPISVTDEEFEAIEKCIRSKTNNTLATTFNVISYIIFIIGFIMGLMFFSIDAIICVTIWSVTSILGISVLWLSEVLRLLQEINNRL